MPEEFDERELLERIDGDMDFLEETVEILEEDYPVLFEAIVRAATAGDAEALVKPAHALKGMLANFCAGPAEAAARDLETKARENRLEDIDSGVKVLARETERLRLALRSFLKANQP